MRSNIVEHQNRTFNTNSFFQREVYCSMFSATQSNTQLPIAKFINACRKIIPTMRMEYSYPIVSRIIRLGLCYPFSVLFQPN